MGKKSPKLVKLSDLQQFIFLVKNCNHRPDVATYINEKSSIKMFFRKIDATTEQSGKLVSAGFYKRKVQSVSKK
jgi:hypothetical protein